MFLITHELVDIFESAFEIYQAYLRRSKIKNVSGGVPLKFLKSQLGWEEFRVRDFIVIQNIITLCFSWQDISMKMNPKCSKTQK